MIINIIDYRGSDPLLFEKRTEKFLQIQNDFVHWRPYHQFVCWTQHDDISNMHSFDLIKKIPRSSAAEARNHVLGYYAKNTWIGLWDNDATLYWNRLKSKDFPRDVDLVLSLADQKKLVAFVPFDPRQCPYPDTIAEDWTFRSTNILKGTMIYLKINEIRFDTTMSAMSDSEYACHQTSLGRKIGRLEQISLNEISPSVSTIFSDTNRKILYAQNKQYIANKYKHLFKKERLGHNNKFIIKRLGELQRSYWNNTVIPAVQNPYFNKFFEME